MIDNLSKTLSLQGEYVRLEPLSEAHLEDLAVAATDGGVWKLQFTSVPHPSELSDWFTACMLERDTDKQRPFAVRNLQTGQVVGSTRYYDIEPTHRNVSIGYTWYGASAQRTAINTEAKLLLLTHAFEVCGSIAVYWHTHHENVRSQAAIQRLGAKLDGVIRKHKIMPNGLPRDTYCYSMIDTEWEKAKCTLIEKLNSY